MKQRNLTILAQMCFMAALMLVSFNSCSDPVKGCTDPDAESYNPDAEESDDTQCVYARDKFIGNYSGSLVCPGTLNAFINNAVYDFTINETAGGGVSDVTVGVTVFGAPVNLAATVNGSALTINQTIPNVSLPYNGTTIPATIAATGSATLGTDQKTLTGAINVSISSAVLPIVLSDSCPISGTKQ